MSWSISSLEEEFYLPPPKKKPKETNESITSLQIQKESETSSCDWLKVYKPKKINELAVNTKKVKELEDWLVQSPNKLLVLAGPSGCGKTTTLEIVCKNLGFKMVEWITPVDKFETRGSLLVADRSPANQFADFLMKSSRFSSCLDSNTSKKVTVVKDFPNIFLVKPPTFHEVLEQLSKERLNNPIVFICSENSFCRKLFPSKMECHIPIIRFSAITNLQMLKILKGIVQKEKRNGDINVLCDKTLGEISSLSKGDIRNAVSQMYFCCLKPYVKRSPSQSLTPEKSKDSQIDFFNGIGKVFSPKKIKARENFKFTNTPETMVDNFLGESKDFIDRLRENFYNKFTNIYDIGNAAQKLATSDLLLARWQEKEIFHEYALSVAIRGVMVTNTNPQEPTFQFYGKNRTVYSEKDVKYLYLEGKSLFPDLCKLDYQCLVDTLPYARYLLGNLNSSQEDYLRKTFNI